MLAEARHGSRYRHCVTASPLCHRRPAAPVPTCAALGERVVHVNQQNGHAQRILWYKFEIGSMHRVHLRDGAACARLEETGPSCDTPIIGQVSQVGSIEARSE